MTGRRLPPCPPQTARVITSRTGFLTQRGSTAFSNEAVQQNETIYPDLIDAAVPAGFFVLPAMGGAEHSDQ
ncbi:hypothetical protein SBV1_2510003 [Verrucomicrobia bacterium]|nr:hypothetical protein SBV1_2510003 [Verrucomicrobiota bacterium]